MIEQSSYFDGMIFLIALWPIFNNFVVKNVVASLLSNLYKLKTENGDLENELTVLTRRRDHLLATCEQRKLLTSQSNTMIYIAFICSIWFYEKTLLCWNYKLFKFILDDNNPESPCAADTDLSSFDYQPNLENIGSSLQIHSTPNK